MGYLAAGLVAGLASCWDHSSWLPRRLTPSQPLSQLPASHVLSLD